MNKLFLLLIIMVCLWQMGCYEPKEGCLDIRAANYDVAADDPCADCCIFPTLQLQVQHRIDLPDTSLVFRYGTFYPNPGNVLDSFVIDRGRFFISNLKLVRDDGVKVGVLDTLQLEAPAGNTVTIEDSFAKLDRDIIQTQTVGTVITEGVFTGVEITVGLEEFLLQTEPLSVPGGHPLSIVGDTLNYDTLAGIYVPVLLFFRQDTTAVSDTLEVRIFEPEPVSLLFDSPLDLVQGFNITLTLKVDYLKWFEGVDVETADLEAIKTAVRQNLPNAISVTEITQ